jgi:pyrroline-5-carboxylate reductase
MKGQIEIAILGAGNIGISIAKGLVLSGEFSAGQINLTRRKVEHLEKYKQEGYKIGNDNIAALKQSDVVIITVEPQQVNNLFDELQSHVVPGKHIVISVVSGLSLKQIKSKLGSDIAAIRAMPNTAIEIRESITCLAVQKEDLDAIEVASSIFDTVGTTLVIDEEQMSPATALGACGIAFFLRAIRAASQGGIEIGFHSEEALKIAAQVAKGAASLLLYKKDHPEFEVDKVTTPRGCTISGLNQMEHEGFSSAMIKGITTSADKAATLYKDD